jgi:molybdopterin-containing oxidoreductase family iron-sulfur binding subunit
MVDDNLCIGCGSCIVACPYDVRTMIQPQHLQRGLFGDGYFTPYEQQAVNRFVAGTIVKCTFCHERVDAGLDPACVTTCPTKARVFGDLDDPDSAVRQLIAQRGGQPPLPEKNTNPKVFYVD